MRVSLQISKSKAKALYLCMSNPKEAEFMKEWDEPIHSPTHSVVVAFPVHEHRIADKSRVTIADLHAAAEKVRQLKVPAEPGTSLIVEKIPSELRVHCVERKQEP